MSFLTSLPQEVLCEIASYLSADHIFSLRLTCKAIERALFEHFSGRFFKTRQFLVPSRPSLQKFLDISEHPFLSKAPQHVILAVDRSLFSERSGIIHHTHLSDPHPMLANSLYARPRDISEDEESINEPGEDRRLLFRIIGNLPNIRTIQLRTSEDQKYRFKPEFFTFDMGDLTLHRPRHLDRSLDYMLVNTLEALATAKARLEALEVVIDYFGCCLHDLAFYVQGPLQPSIATTLSGLKQLTLAVSLRSARTNLTTDLDDAFCFQKFLKLTPNLVSLQLHFCKFEDQIDAWHFFDWLGRQADSNLPGPSAEMTPSGPSLEQPDPVQFSQLERLGLDVLTVSPSIVMKLIAKFRPSLRRLHLNNVFLADLHNDVESRVNIWTTLLKNIAANSELTEWTIGIQGVYHCRAGADPSITFGNFSNGLNVASYRGDDAKAALEAAADDVTLLWDLEEDDNELEEESEDTDASGGTEE
ncbi:hypothetical protein BR93DRAFT_976724 [Coniochaeta sp. PMI_546]|nr:hypothetical protein BR93DRAFT_976724 [Coniochaeta sp. PMI_546]